MLLELLLSLVFSEEASQLTYVADATQAITERVLVARRIISQDRPSRRPMIANNFSNREIRFFWSRDQIKHIHIYSSYFHIQPSVLGLNVTWASFNFIILLASIAVAHESRQIRNTVRFPFRIPFTAYFEDGHVIDSVTDNISLGGLAFSLPKNYELADREISEISMKVDNRSFALPTKVVSKSGSLVRLQFEAASMPEQKKLVAALMGQADAWLHYGPEEKPVSTIASMKHILKIIFGLLRYRPQKRINKKAAIKNEKGAVKK